MLKGINALHPSRFVQAKPLALAKLEQIDQWLSNQIKDARINNNRALELKATRDRAIILLGFWRGFRSDELSSTEAINTVNRASGFLNEFDPMQHAYVKGRPDDRNFYAGIIALGAHIGTKKLQRQDRQSRVPPWNPQLPRIFV